MAINDEYVGNYEIISLDLETPEGNIIDLSNDFGGLQIFEDLFTPYVTATVTFVDSIGLFEALPISGKETIRAQFKAKDLNEEYALDLRVYKADFVENGDKNVTVNLYCITKEKLINDTKFVGRAYQDQLYSEMATKIMKEYIGAEISTQPTLYRHNFIFHDFLRPFDAINVAASRSISESRTADYFFFQNQYGFHFKPFNYLLGQDSTQTYEIKTGAKETPQDTPESEKQVYNNVIQKYTFNSRFDVLKKLKQGMYGSNLLTYDIVRGKYVEYTKKYSTEFETHLHTDNYKFNTNQLDVIDSVYAASRYYPTNKDHDTLSHIADNQPNIRPNQVEQWLLKRVTQLAEIGSLSLDIIVPGDNRRAVGDKVTIDFPSYRYLSPQDEERKELDKYLQGDYIVTSLNHQVTASKFLTHMTVIKTGYYNELAIDDELKRIL